MCQAVLNLKVLMQIGDSQRVYVFERPSEFLGKFPADHFDGFLVIQRPKIDSLTQFFGSPSLSGFHDLAKTALTNSR